MRLTLVRKAAIALAAVAGSVGLSMAAPVAAHAEEPASATQTLANPSLYEEVTVDGTVDGSSLYERRTIVGVIAIDDGAGCTQYFIFYSDGSVRTTVRCVVIIQG